MTKPKRTASPFKIVSGTNDPVFRAIGAHHRAARIFIAALLAESESSEGFSEATEAPRNAMFAAGCALVKTKPATVAGAIAMLQYLATLHTRRGELCREIAGASARPATRRRGA
jgi:hypothetical protein